MKKLLIMAAIAAAAYVPASSYLWQPEPMVAYRVEVDQGDTLWTLCSRIASDADNLQEVVSRAKVENGIQDVTALQPGQEITVRVKEVRK